MFTEDQLMSFSYSVDFGTPEWFKLYYHGISVVSTIISFFSMYVILFQSGKMDGYRYYLFYMQTYTAFTICLVASALNSCFVRKHQAISKISSKYLLDDIPYIIVIALLNFYPFVAATLLYLSMLTKENQVILVKEVYPNLVQNFKNLPNYVVFDSNFWAIVFFAFIFFGCTYTLILIVTTTYQMFKILEDNRKHISSSNYAKHRATLRSLLAQFATCFLIVGPASIFSFLVVIRYEHSQVATHWIIVALTLHSSANAIVMIITYPPYRSFVTLWRPNRSFHFSTVHRSSEMNTRMNTERSFAVTVTS
uniref:Serpentine Receptor, class T n=2 Tax=Caenorhabditis tropicalis TaxID=1561998 RepID=A0A1I7T4J8_9PELO